MAIKLPSFQSFSVSSAKSRVLLVMVVIVLVGAGIFYAARYLGGDVVGASQIAAAPADLQSIPGGQLSPEYSRALAAANTQASQQAQITGGSAVPTLMNIPTAPSSFPQPQQNCTVLCPDPQKADIFKDINDLVKAGKLSAADAKSLSDMAKANVSVSEYADYLASLVKAGKLSPEQARQLLEKYKKRHQDALLAKNAAVMDGLIRSGQLTLDKANGLLALQKNGATPAMLANELNRMVKNGDLSQQAADAILSQYIANQAADKTQESAYALKKLVRKGALTPAVGDALAKMQLENAPVSAYQAKLDSLVASGQLTPAVAKELMSAYAKMRAGLGVSDTLNTMLASLAAEAARCTANVAEKSQLPRDVVDELVKLQTQGVSLTEYQQALKAMVASGKINDKDVASFLACYQKLLASREQINRLVKMQGNNASTRDYADELKQGVLSGVLSPEEAGRLMQEYVAMVTPVSVLPSSEPTLPGTEDFARLQQRLQEAQSTSAETPAVNDAQAASQFAAAQAQAQLEAEQARQQRIQQLQSLMTSQAQTILTSAWTAPKMLHVDGQPAATGATQNTGAQATAGTINGANNSVASNNARAIEEPPLIKSGTILFGVLDTAVNSDYPDTPVLVTIVQGPYKGATLIGKLSLAQGQDRVSLNFEQMNRDSWTRAKKISAYAIDPDTARTVMASNVDYHYFKRYGALFASSFLSGYASAIQNAGTTATVFGGTSSTYPALSPGNRIAVGLGQVGTELGNAVKTYFDTPATVRINSGVGLGILFVGDVT